MQFFFSSRRRHTRLQGDWSSDVCSSDLMRETQHKRGDHSRNGEGQDNADRKSTRLNSSHLVISYAVFCLKKKKKKKKICAFVITIPSSLTNQMLCNDTSIRQTD